MPGILGAMFAAAALITGGFMLVIGLVMFAVYPWMLLWAVPLAIVLILWGRQRLFHPKRTTFDLERDWQMLYPEGYIPPHRRGQAAPEQHHYIEPFTVGGFMRGDADYRG